MATLTGAVRDRRPSRAWTVLVAAVGRVAAGTRTLGERLSGSVLTMAGFGCVDVGAFTANTVAGWVVTGVSVLLLDWKLE